MKDKIFISLLLICLSFGAVLGQTTTEDVVYFKDGSILRGQILEYTPKSEIKIQVRGGSILVYPSSTILKIEKEKSTNEVQPVEKPRTLHVPQSRGWYHSFAGSNVIPAPFTGPGFFSVFNLLGFKLEYSVGYKFHKLFGVGLHIGFLAAGADGTVPICANFRGYLMEKSVSPYYDMNIGYGLSLNSLSGINGNGSTSGGLHLHPAIGVRFPSTRKGHTTLDLGYLIQMGRTTGFGGERTTLFALTLRVGATF
ncbi:MULTISPECIES: hypothetical protein [unclassified Aureispira]|uniref:hypothetical protein n=1 Tax=unclassified Aureispira TaxID=2649989 RepID=UPI00069734A7|nr:MULTISPECIES: hypothetical protein [unclassified Aureispira]WMX12760.1 hypothetical protein QP953_18155 [Aureispira sp. CCB-E]